MFLLFRETKACQLKGLEFSQQKTTFICCFHNSKISLFLAVTSFGQAHNWSKPGVHFDIVTQLFEHAQNRYHIKLCQTMRDLLALLLSPCYFLIIRLKKKKHIWNYLFCCCCPLSVLQKGRSYQPCKKNRYAGVQGQMELLGSCM